VTEVEPVRALEAVMDGYRVMPMKEAAKEGDLFVTVTGDINVVDEPHLKAMKSGAILANSGHFNDEINLSALDGMAESVRTIRTSLEEYRLHDGRKLFVLGEGRLVNLAAAEGHPAAVMDMSFANQALSAEYLVTHARELQPRVYPVPDDIDREIARLKFAAMQITTDTYVEMRDVIRDTIEQAGYDHPGFGFDAETCGVIVSIQKQSPDIAQGVDTGGAGDQGMMFGFACDETPELMPMPIQLAHQLARQLARVRKDKTLPYLGPDGKTQVTIEYVDGRPMRVDTVVLSAQHTEDVDLTRIREDLQELVLEQVVPAKMLDQRSTIHVNPTGRFVLGGPRADAGVTGR